MTIIISILIVLLLVCVKKCLELRVKSAKEYFEKIEIIHRLQEKLEKKNQQIEDLREELRNTLGRL